MGQPKKAFTKIHNGESLTITQKEHICNLAASTLSVSLSALKLKSKFTCLNPWRAGDITKLAEQIQLHTCTEKCAWADGRDGCYQMFPRLPSEFTLISAVLQQPANPFEKEIRDYFIEECQ